MWRPNSWGSGRCGTHFLCLEDIKNFLVKLLVFPSHHHLVRHPLLSTVLGNFLFPWVNIPYFLFLIYILVLWWGVGLLFTCLWIWKNNQKLFILIDSIGSSIYHGSQSWIKIIRNYKAACNMEFVSDCCWQSLSWSSILILNVWDEK